MLAKIGARAVFYRTDPANGWLPDIEHVRSLDHAGDARARRHRSEQPDRRDLSDEARRALVDLADEHNFPLLADEVYADLAFDGPVGAARRAQSRRADHHVLVAVEGVPRAGLARRLDGGRPRPSGSTMCSAAIKKLADGRLCSTGPMEHAIAAALNGDRSHQQAFRDALRERARADRTRG